MLRGHSFAPRFTVSVQAVDIPDFLECIPKISIRGAGKSFFELPKCPGPLTIGDLGDDSYEVKYGSQWLLELCEYNQFYLYQNNLGFEPIDPPEPFPIPDETSRHCDIAFDQAAQPLICWEQSDGIRIWQYDQLTESYVVAGPYTGINPCMFNDVTVEGFRYEADSDIVLFYQKTGEQNKVFYRIQRESYAAEYEHYIAGSDFLVDAIRPLYLRNELLISSLAGDRFAGDIILKSKLYPMHRTLTIEGLGEFTLGDMYTAEVNPHTMAIDGVGEFTSGLLYLPPINPHTMAIDGLGEFTLGLLYTVETNSHTMAIDGLGEFTGGFWLVAEVYSHTMAIDGSAQFTGGNLATV